MVRGLLPALRFARGWRSPAADLGEEALSLRVPGGPDARAVRVAPAGPGPHPGWVVLHGLTVPGTEHPALRRFVHALASTGGSVTIPEIREWTDLRFEPERAQAVIRAAVLQVAADPATRPGGVVLVGFSFGGPQALLAAADSEVAARLRGVVAWGSYADLETVTAFQFTGEHEYGGRRFRQPPDPYGRWIIGANCLRLVPGLDDDGRVADSLHALAERAGRLQIASAGPGMEPLRLELERDLGEASRGLFTLFAPPPGAAPHRERALEVVEAMAAAARARIPLLDPVPGIGRVPVPLRLLHGRDDLLIPFTQTRHLRDRLEGRTPDLAVGITGLFSHSGKPGELARPLARVREQARFLGVLRRVFELA